MLKQLREDGEAITIDQVKCVVNSVFGYVKVSEDKNIAHLSFMP
jgi:hypothetical protein